MPSTEIDYRVRRVSASARRDDELIERAARRTDLAGTALAGAAADLAAAHSEESGALSGLAEVVHEEATRVSNLAEDIESHRANLYSP